jgi:hypothetical protein
MPHAPYAWERRTAFVRLIYETDEGDEVFFSRHITAAGASEYRIDGRVVSADGYNERLKVFGILVKARNFLVFQARPPHHLPPHLNLAVCSWCTSALFD